MEEKKSKIKLKVNFGKVSAILVAVFAVLLTVDLVLKYCEEAYGWNFSVIPKLITVESGIRNPGAAFSFLANKGWGQIFLIILTFIAFAALVFGFLVIPERFKILKIAITLVASGAVGNLIDRLAFLEVRDFVWINMFGKWACCNFADFWIVFGVILAVIDMLFLNEWAVFPLTKKAKAAQKKRDVDKNSAEKERSSAQAEENFKEGEEHFKEDAAKTCGQIAEEDRAVKDSGGSTNEDTGEDE